ncbi:hypothetical protein CEXT_193631 [Caerostris extrusa]|uniref:Transmembrane protein n=1 Tax=Caerostris extrusa TaxID=172846 RepID=A0AAV4XLR4_CAEEX|nr:hypothetical protein CEXT_193631 [Caerostris extrusa]
MLLVMIVAQPSPRTLGKSLPRFFIFIFFSFQSQPFGERQQGPLFFSSSACHCLPVSALLSSRRRYRGNGPNRKEEEWKQPNRKDCPVKKRKKKKEGIPGRQLPSLITWANECHFFRTRITHQLRAKKSFSFFLFFLFSSFFFRSSGGESAGRSLSLPFRFSATARVNKSRGRTRLVSVYEEQRL